MKNERDSAFEAMLAWCREVLGPCAPVADASKEHPGHISGTHRLRHADGYCFLKIHADAQHWANEVHGYEQWAPAFGEAAPRLLAVREEAPLALLVSELPGSVMENAGLSSAQERAAWRAAGRALAGLHALPAGEFFGPCQRDGSSVGTPITDAAAYVAAEFQDWLERGVRGGFLDANEQAIVAAARGLLPSFAGEHPVACHRDYCPPNWLVSPQGAWVGVIDFEFARWDVRAADFTRYPGWEWIERPDRAAAFFEGYGRAFSPAEEQQRLAMHALYALGAIVWGMESAFYGFAAEGRRALQHVGGLLK